MAAIKLNHAESSHIVGASYDEDTQELAVSFKGGTYVYENVNAQVASEFEKAPSAGKFLESSIKGVYPFRKVTA